MSLLEIVETFEEMTESGHRFLLTYPTAYPDNYIQKNMEKFGAFFEDKELLLSMLYASVYCEQMYGTSIIEFGTYHFEKKPHSERIKYITWENRFLYTAFLNKASDTHILDNKYEAYTLLKPFFKREAMLLENEKDYDLFCSFVKKNPAIFVKPNNMELAIGAHRLVYSGSTLRDTFDALCKEATEISGDVIKRKSDHRLILEEQIVPSAFMRELNPNELSLLRVTTIYVKGQVHFFYPCLRLLFGDGAERCGEDYSFVALIDADSGKVITNGKSAAGDSDVNPVTGQKICGMVMPDWENLKDMLTCAAKRLPTIRHIGWDVTHTDKGWCIIEGNPNGEFFYQMCVEHGVKEELEDLIGFHLPYDFFRNPMFRKNQNQMQRNYMEEIYG